jgi:hypothetical protein
MISAHLVGYNNNVRYRGRVFHIQTEDSGLDKPRIMTHLFADGGHIIQSMRTDYGDYLERQDRTSLVTNLMQQQHRAMFVTLRTGKLDEKIEAAIGPHPLPFEPPARLPKSIDSIPSPAGSLPPGSDGSTE